MFWCFLQDVRKIYNHLGFFLKKIPDFRTFRTSNLVEKIDPALLDRADLKEYIPLPGPKVLLKILLQSTIELCKKGIVVTELRDPCLNQALEPIAVLANQCKISGRTVKKLPFIACLPEKSSFSFCEPISLQNYLKNFGRV